MGIELLVTVVGGILTAVVLRFLKIEKDAKKVNIEESLVVTKSPIEIQGNQNTINNLVNSNINISSEQTDSAVKLRTKFDSLEEAKKRGRILFIDDEKYYKMPDILKRNGWTNSSLINDPATLDLDDIKNADIFFVDIHGIGKKLQLPDEGLGLAKVLQEKFPNKYVVIYSTEQTGDRFHEALRKSDDFLRKSANFYEFEKCITELLVK